MEDKNDWCGNIAKEVDKHKQRFSIALWLPLGVGIDLPLGIPLGNIAFGIPIGLAIGAAIGASLDAKAKKEGRVI